MTTTRRGRRWAPPVLQAGLALLAACLLGPAGARAQWTQPDASGNIGNTNPGNVRIGGAGAAPTAVVHTRGNLSSPLTGTVAVTQNSAAVTGTGTAFTTELAVGDSIKIGAEVFTVSAIASATSLTLDSNYLGASASGAAAYRDPNLLAVDNGDGVNRLTVTRSGRVGIGTSSPAMLLNLSDTSTSAYRGLGIGQYSNDAGGALIHFGKHRGTTAAPTALANGDDIGSILANGYFGSGYYTSAGITFQVNGAVSSTSMPTDIVFRTGTAVSAENMRLTSVGNLGLGTAAPNQKLSVVGTGAFYNSTPVTPSGVRGLFMGNYSTGSSIWSYNYAGAVGDSLTVSAQDLNFATYSGGNGVTRVFVANGGNVGVGTTSPAYKLDVAGSVNSSGLCLAGLCKTDWAQVGGGQWANGSGNINYTGGNVGVGTTAPIRGFQISGPNGSGLSEFVLENTGMPANNRKLNLWGSATYGTAGRFFLRLLNDAGNATTRDFMSFDNATGNIGVGTVLPSSLLEVRRDQAAGTELKVTNADAGGFAGVYLNSALGQSAGGFLQWNNTTGANNLFVATGGNNPLYLGTNNTARVTVMPTSGNVGIGTTNPIMRLQVTGQADNLFQVVSTGSAATDTVANFSSAVGNILQVRGNGNVGIGTGNPASMLFVGGGTPSVATLPGINVALGPSVGSYLSASNGTINTFVGTDNSPYGIVGTLSNHPLGLRANNTLAVTVLPSGNVGVGTTAPAQKLDVAGNVNAAGLCIGGTCKTDWAQIGGGGSSQWANGAASSINYGAGSVGIGTATPANNLHVVGSARVDGAGRVYIGTTAPQGARGLEFVEETPTTFSIRHHDPWVAWRNIALNPYAGNVGVNTLNPIAPLTVGDASSDNADGFIVLGKKSASGTRQARIGFDANFNFVIGDYGNNNVAGPWTSPFAINWQAPSNSLYVNSAGKVGVGTATPAEALDVVGNIRATGSVSATYQDVAEWVPSTQKLQAGTVVVLDAGRTNHVVASESAYDTKVAGVVSDSPGVILGVGGEGRLKVATTGRVKVKADATRGPIEVGDLLVTSDVEGLAMKSEPIVIGGRKIHAPGTIIGKALEPLAKGTGEILVLLSLQ